MARGLWKGAISFGAKEPAGAEVIDLMALLKKSVARKQEKPRRQHKARRRAA